MLVKRIMIICLTTAMCMLSPISAFAVEESQAASENYAEQVKEDEPQKDAGLIVGATAWLSYASGTVFINADTLGSDVMAVIGEVDIEIQRSSNGTSGWTTYVSVADQTASNSRTHHLINHGVVVVSGYYRVVMTHYAKEQGWWFPKTQTIQSTSSVVYVS